MRHVDLDPVGAMIELLAAPACGASLATDRRASLLNRLARLDVLLIDEFGYLNIKPEQSNTFFN